MRFRLAALALAAAGLAAPATAAEPAADLTKYLPDGANVYVHVNVQQFLAAPVIRKAIPMAVDKYSEALMNVVNLVKALDPNAANISNDQVQQAIDALKKPQTIANAFDAAKDAVTDVVVGGVQGSEDQFLVVIKCNEAVTPEMVKGLSALVGGNPQVQLKSYDKGGKTIYEITLPQQPVPMYAVLPKAGVLCIGGSKDVVEKAAKGAGSGLAGATKTLAAERKKTDFLFVAMAGKGDDENTPVSAWARLVLDKDITGEMMAKFKSAAKAATEAKEANEGIAHAVETIKSALGPQGKDVAAALDKAKAVATGDTVTGKLSIPGTVVEKLLSKDK